MRWSIMKTYSQRHNAEQAAISALKKHNAEGKRGIGYMFVVRSDNRIHPVIYFDPHAIDLSKEERLKLENVLTNAGFTVMIGKIPESVC